jgi:hypothetical protein
MGYEINSTWTRLRRNDIEKLNEILDDEYCRELEIGRKLNIMNFVTRKFEEALKEFDFGRVIKFMRQTHWVWALEGGERVPTKSEMISFIRRNFLKHALYQMIELGENRYCASSGGIVFDAGIESSSPGPDDVWVIISFDIS